MTTLGLKNVNLLSKEQYEGVAEPARDELWVIEAVESYSDDDGNWYRIYPDGWCEQGGNFGGKTTGYTTITLTLLKPFRDVNYFVTAMNDKNSDSYAPTFTAKTKTSFTVRNTINNTGLGCWEAKGYIA